MSRVIRTEVVTSTVTIKEVTPQVCIGPDKSMTVTRAVETASGLVSYTEPTVRTGGCPTNPEDYEYVSGYAGTRRFSYEEILTMDDPVCVSGMTLRISDIPAIVAAAVEALADRMAHERAVIAARIATPAHTPAICPPTVAEEPVVVLEADSESVP